MSWHDSRKLADKFIDLFADNRIYPSQWKYMIPLFIVQGPYPGIINAKNFADGIEYSIQLYDVTIPPDKLAYQSMKPEDWMMD